MATCSKRMLSMGRWIGCESRKILLLTARCERVYYTRMQQNVSTNGEMREFMLVIRRALLLVIHYIERRYNIERPTN